MAVLQPVTSGQDRLLDSIFQGAYPRPARQRSSNTASSWSRDLLEPSFKAKPSHASGLRPPGVPWLILPNETAKIDRLPE